MIFSRRSRLLFGLWVLLCACGKPNAAFGNDPVITASERLIFRIEVCINRPEILSEFYNLIIKLMNDNGLRIAKTDFINKSFEKGYFMESFIKDDGAGPIVSAWKFSKDDFIRVLIYQRKGESLSEYYKDFSYSILNDLRKNGFIPCKSVYSIF